MRVAVVGAGYIGRVHVRVLSRIAHEDPGLVDEIYVSDIDPSRARRAARLYNAKPVGPPRELPRGIDFAVVAVPTSAHRVVVEELVSKGVTGLLVEKPLASSPADSAVIAGLHERGEAWIASGHVERFNPAAAGLISWIARGSLGEVLASSARRIGPFAPRAGGVDVILDLGVHEVDMAMAVRGGAPRAVRGYTLAGVASELNDYAIVVLSFEDSYSTMELSRITPYKQRTLTVTGTKASAQLDYISQETIVYTAEMEARLRIAREEPIYLEDLATLRAYARYQPPPVDAYQGHVAVEICSAAIASAARGAEEALTPAHPEWLEAALEGYRRYRNSLAAGGVEALLGGAGNG